MRELYHISKEGLQSSIRGPLSSASQMSVSGAPPGPPPSSPAQKSPTSTAPVLSEGRRAWKAYGIAFQEESVLIHSVIEGVKIWKLRAEV